jgi:hypothetical protein
MTEFTITWSVKLVSFVMFWNSRLSYCVKWIDILTVIQHSATIWIPTIVVFLRSSDFLILRLFWQMRHWSQSKKCLLALWNLVWNFYWQLSHFIPMIQKKHINVDDVYITHNWISAYINITHILIYTPLEWFLYIKLMHKNCIVWILDDKMTFVTGNQLQKKNAVSNIN